MKRAALLKPLLSGALSLSIPAAVVAQGQNSDASRPGTSASCLTEREVQSVTTWLLPDGIDALARRCRGVLPSNAFLTTAAAALAERYRGERSSDADMAKRAIARVGGDLPLSLFGDDVSGTVIAEAAAQQISTRDCAKADRLASLLSPLPRASIGEVAAMLIATGLRNSDTSALPIRLCRAAR